MTLLDIGCGWGAASLCALQRYDVNVIALTLSRNQQAYVEGLLAQSGSTRSARVLLEGWERFHEPVDRIVAIGPLEHFGYDRYDEFFSRAYELLPADGTMLLHCIVASSKAELAERNLPVTMQLLRFIKFIIDDIFPGGRLPLVSMVEEHATRAGFTVNRVQPLQQHYARTLDLWSAALESRRDEAIAIQSAEVYDQYMRYLTGCAELFRDGYTNVCQFTLDKSQQR
jgi:cyclopropane-fatty-acyl-phospholipid synthase